MPNAPVLPRRPSAFQVHERSSAPHAVAPPAQEPRAGRLRTVRLGSARLSPAGRFRRHHDRGEAGSPAPRAASRRPCNILVGPLIGRAAPSSVRATCQAASTWPAPPPRTCRTAFRLPANLTTACSCSHGRQQGRYQPSLRRLGEAILILRPAGFRTPARCRQSGCAWLAVGCIVEPSCQHHLLAASSVGWGASDISVDGGICRLLLLESRCVAWNLAATLNDLPASLRAWISIRVLRPGHGLSRHSGPPWPRAPR